MTIDQLMLHLPEGYGKRAASISRLIAGELGRMPMVSATRIEHLVVPEIRLTHQQTDQQLATIIAASIHQQVVGKTGHGNG